MIELDVNRGRYVGFGSMKASWSNVVDFKLLFLLKSYEKGGSIGRFTVYSLRAKSWTSDCSTSFPSGHILQKGGIYLNGVIHWLALGGEAAGTAYILTFNLVSETFGKIDLPRTNGMDSQDTNKNFVSAFDNQYLQFGMVDPVVECLNLWVMHVNGSESLWFRHRIVGPLIKTGLMLRYFDCVGGVICQADLSGKFWFHIKGNSNEHDIGLYGHSKWYGYAERLQINCKII